MLFSELRFVVFFAVVFSVHWGLRHHRARKAWLLLASYAFYAGWDARFLALIIASTAIDYVAGWMLARDLPPRRRRAWLAASLAGNLGILGLFKYADFFIATGAAFFSWLGLPLSARSLELVLPVGVSFYTFQSLSYTIDVFRRRLPATRDPLDFALFVAFFPQLVAGPILRAAHFLPQLQAPRRLQQVDFRRLLVLFLVGYAKKACVADNLAALLDPIFAAPLGASSLSLALALPLYGAQIYCDFSGYSDMAVASAGLLGFHLPDNFRHPYLAASVTDFWRRWHVSLSQWFRDYLYLPLGGNRRGRLRTYRNLLLVFLLCGLWHGASFTFVAWGLHHGALLVLERRFPSLRAGAFSWPRWLYAQAAVALAWAWFRAPGLPAALGHLRGLLPTGAPQGAAAALAPAWVLLLGALVTAHFVTRRWPPAERLARIPWPLFAAGFGASVALVLPWAAAGYKPFIYFQF